MAAVTATAAEEEGERMRKIGWRERQRQRETGSETDPLFLRENVFSRFTGSSPGVSWFPALFWLERRGREIEGAWETGEGLSSRAEREMSAKTRREQGMRDECLSSSSSREARHERPSQSHLSPRISNSDL